MHQVPILGIFKTLQECSQSNLIVFEYVDVMCLYFHSFKSPSFQFESKIVQNVAKSEVSHHIFTGLHARSLQTLLQDKTLGMIADQNNFCMTSNNQVLNLNQ